MATEIPARWFSTYSPSTDKLKVAVIYGDASNYDYLKSRLDQLKSGYGPSSSQEPNSVTTITRRSVTSGSIAQRNIITDHEADIAALWD
eukprot:6256033-Amphidinium_carterae.1